MSYSIGGTYKNYLITKVVPLQEIGSTLIECTHQPSGASIIKLINEDEENLFALSFKTWPTTSNGIAHILEHTVLCGSKKYPVKDPFFGMTRRSLNTYMNALTGGDFTCYPAATQVHQDFYHLLSVYLDAVFHPKLDPFSLMQEGCHLEFKEKKDPSSPLQFKGIVFNEMKGALGNKESRLSEAIMHALYPDITYGVNSGGDPKEIPSLTYEQLKEFHQTYYHPSRCYFFFYGNLPLEEQLDFLEEHAFKEIEKKEPLPLLARQKHFDQEKRLITYYPALPEQDEEQVLVAICYLTCSILEQEELLALNVLDILLMGTDGSPLKMALLKSNLCKQVDEVIDNEMNDVPYIIMCKGCKEETAEQIEKLIDTTLTQIAEEGFSEEMIEGAIHQLEMARLEITGGSTPYGLSLFFRSILLKQHGGNPEDALMIHSLFAKLRTRKPSTYCQLIKKYFLNNRHKAVIEMRPDLHLGKQEERAEKEKLDKIKSSLSSEETKAIITKSIELEKFQKASEESSIECLPKITLEDVPKQGKEFSLEKSSFGPITLYAHDCFTNQLLYVDLVLDLPQCTPEEMPYLRLFCYLLPQIGTGGRNYKDTLDFMLQHTGGITAFFDLGHHVDDPNMMHPFFCLRGKALYRKADKLFTLLKDTLNNPDFSDEERIHELLIQHLHSVESNIQRSPLRFGVNLAASHFSAPSAIIHQCYGLAYYWQLKKIVADYKKKPTFFLNKCREFAGRILTLNKADLIVSADEEMLTTIKQNNLFGLSEIGQKNLPLWDSSLFSPISVLSQAREIISPVSFTTLLFPTINYKHEGAAALSVASEIMENLTLHPLIRERGGAYGSGASFIPLLGQFHFYTYRDPHLAASLKAFTTAISQLCQGKFSEEELEQAKLQIFQDLDTPHPPCARAYTAYTRIRSGRTAEMRQKYRTRLFGVNKTEIQTGAKEFLKKEIKKAILITFAGKEFLEKELPQLESSIPCYSIEEEM